MAPTATVVNDLLNTLEEDDLNTAIRYIQFLSVSRKQEKVKQSKEALQEIQSMFADGDKGWSSEAEMIEDMAEFRRCRLDELSPIAVKKVKKQVDISVQHAYNNVVK